jgi:predicted RNase H-like HicB family nuclease
VPLIIEVEQEEDGRWLAQVVELPGVLAYGQTRQEAIDRVKALSLRVLADRLDHGEHVKPAHWPAHFFDDIRIDDPAFGRPDQGSGPPAPSLE